MRKSIFVIGGLGLGGCLALSLGLRELLAVQQERQRSPLASLLEGHFSRRLVGRVHVQWVDANGRQQLEARLAVFSGLRKEPIAEAAGELLWLNAANHGRRPDSVVVRVEDDDGGVPFVMDVPARLPSMPRR